jgi:hypothetical protein
MYEEQEFWVEGSNIYRTMLGGSVTTVWRVPGLRMEVRPPAMEGGCEYIE